MADDTEQGKESPTEGAEAPPAEEPQKPEGLGFTKLEKNTLIGCAVLIIVVGIWALIYLAGHVQA